MKDYSKCGRHFDLELKQQSMALITNGHTMIEVSRDLGVLTWSLRVVSNF